MHRRIDRLGTKACVLGVVFIAVLGIALGVSSAPNQFRSPDICLRETSVDQECVKAFRQSQTSQYRRYFRQDEKQLVLLDGRGKKVANFQNTTGESNYEFYSFDDLNKDVGYFLVNHSVDEGSEYVLVSLASGKQFTMSGIPVISPDRKKMVTTDCEPDPEVSFNGTNMTLVYEITPQTLISERVSAINGCFAKAQWVNSKTISLEGLPGEDSKSAGRLTFQNGAWEFLLQQH